MRQAYKELLARDATPQDVEAFLKESNKRGSLMLDLAATSNRFWLTPENILSRLEATHWEIPPNRSQLVMARFTKQAIRRTGGAIIPDLLIYEDGSVVIPAPKGRTAITGHLTATELKEIRDEIKDQQQFFAIAPLRTNEDKKILNEGKTNADQKVNEWSTGSLQIWVRDAARWHTVHSFLFSWTYGRDGKPWPDEIKRLHAIDQRLLQVRERMAGVAREVKSQSSAETAENRDSPAATPRASTPPEDKYVHELFKLWQAAARADGKIPGGLVGRLRAKVEEFVRNNRNDASGAPYAKKVEPILSRLDASHNWSPDEALALLNDLAALSSIPIETTLWADSERRVYPGQPLPADLKDAPWGEPTAEGLRAARPLDPRAESYPVGTALRSRILLHNDGKEPLLLRAKSWMQPGYAARDAMGNPLHVESTQWTTLGRVQTWRLAPGEFIEIATPGFGVGKDARKEEWADVRVGSWIDVADGVDVTLSPGSIGVFVDDSRASKPASGRELKLEIIRERLDCERPLPASAADRELIVRRVTQDIFGGEPTPDEISAFVTDKSDDPFSALAGRLYRRVGLAAFVGELKPGTITFRTTPADPDAANRPKVAIGPGRYTLDDHVRLIIVGKPVAGRRTSDVEIRFWAADKKSEPPGPPHKIQVPDGFGTWAITCRPGTGILWVLTKGAVRKIDYSNPAGVKETAITRGSSDDMPDEFREAVKRIMTISNVPAEQITALLAGSAPE